MIDFTSQEKNFLIKMVKGQKDWYYYQNKINPMPVFEEGYENLKSILEKIEGKEQSEKEYSIIHPLIKKLGNKNK